MKLKLSLQRQVDHYVDIVVTADSTATVADVAATIAAADPLAHHHARTPGAGVTLSVAPPVKRISAGWHPSARATGARARSRAGRPAGAGG